MKQTKRFLWLIVLLSLIPGLILAYTRGRVEGGSTSVTLLMDEQALGEQAAFLGTTSFELGERYRAAGLNGIALYEETFETLAAAGEVALLSGNAARAEDALSAGDITVPANSVLVTALEPDALRPTLAKNTPEPQEISFGNTTWYAYPDPGDGEGEERPAGPNREEVERWAEAGWDIAYRPYNYPGLREVGADFPTEANYLIHGALEVAGNPNALSQTVATSQDYLTGVIEGVEQAGMAQLEGKVPVARTFGINQDWLNTLEPEVVVGKYVLATNERGARLLYVRPYTEETVGDMVQNTESLVRGLRTSLEAEGYSVGEVRRLEYDTIPLLRALSAVGIVAGLVLLAFMYPGVWGIVVSVAVLSLGILAGGLDWDALALAAALAFPVLGYGLLPEKLTSLGLATLISLAGAVLLAAVGSDREAMLAITPFAGVAATLVVPPALFLFHYALRYRPPAKWITDFWRYPVRLGDVAIVFIGLAALAVVLLRRGNFPIIGASGAELGLRELLSEYFARPRFKELLGHPLAVLALTNSGWAAWLRGLLLTGGVVAQASIINSFSHYHTPLLVSLERTLVALALGLVIGLLLTPLARLATSGVKRWLTGARRASRV